MSSVTFDDVTLVLGGRTILSSVSFAIEAGEFIGLLGPNGAGKTTLLRAILGLVRPRSGAVGVLGRPAVRGNRAVGYMPQVRGSTDLRWTGWDFVAGAAGGHRWGLPRLDRAARDEGAGALDIVGATELARRPLSDLSGGERQRLLLSQALLGRPSLLLLDEPLISLDPTHQRGVVDLVAIPDKPPTIALRAVPKANARGSLTLSYSVGDDYGVASAEALLADPATLSLLAIKLAQSRAR